MVELNTAEIALRALQAVITRLDRDEKAILEAANLLKGNQYRGLHARLLSIVKPLEIDYYDDMTRVCGPVEF